MAAAWTAWTTSNRPAPTDEAGIPPGVPAFFCPRLRGTAGRLSISPQPEQVPQITDTTRAPHGRIWSGHPRLRRSYVDRRKGVDDRDEPGQGDLELFSGRCKQPVSLNRTAVAQRSRKRGVGKAYTFFAMISTAVRFLDQRLSENFTPFRKRKLGCSALILTQNQFVKLICLQKRHVGKFYNSYRL